MDCRARKPEEKFKRRKWQISLLCDVSNVDLPLQIAQDSDTKESEVLNGHLWRDWLLEQMCTLQETDSHNIDFLVFIVMPACAASLEISSMISMAEFFKLFQHFPVGTCR